MVSWLFSLGFIPTIKFLKLTIITTFTEVDDVLFVGKGFTYPGIYPTRSLAHCFGHTKYSITIIQKIEQK